ncbi:Uncharacterised protein [Mycobacteroides abscessus subsp. abscessus]|nr:Uncharacterised protein [Mycobacteroides abscessus subsp. abscessus]
MRPLFAFAGARRAPSGSAGDSPVVPKPPPAASPTFVSSPTLVPSPSAAPPTTVLSSTAPAPRRVRDSLAASFIAHGPVSPSRKYARVSSRSWSGRSRFPRRLSFFAHPDFFLLPIQLTQFA